MIHIEFNLVILFGVMYLLYIVLKQNKQITALQHKLTQLSQSHLQESPIKNELIQLLNDGHDVKAVKRVRETMGFSLLEAKQYVDTLKLEQNRTS